MRKLGLSLSLTSAAMAVRSAFKIASVNPVLWWDAESHRAGLVGGAATLFQDSAGATAVSAVEQPVGLVRSIANSGPRKNLLTYSEQFDNAAWTKTTAGGGALPIVTPNYSTAPDGNVTAERVIFLASVSGDRSILSLSTATSAGSKYTSSLYMRADTPADVGKLVAARGVANASYTLFTLASTWQRVSLTEFASGAFGGLTLEVRPSVGSSAGTVAAHIWGAQLETGSVASDYQKITSGVEYLDALQATSTARPVLKGIEAAPLMLQFDGVDDALSTGTFAAGTLPANADVYVVMHRNADDGRFVMLHGQGAGAYIGAFETTTSTFGNSGSGSPAIAINGAVISGIVTPPAAVSFLIEARGANLASWTSANHGMYSAGWQTAGRIGAVLITPAQPDATRAKIRKALAKAYQITGVV